MAKYYVKRVRPDGNTLWIQASGRWSPKPKQGGRYDNRSRAISWRRRLLTFESVSAARQFVSEYKAIHPRITDKITWINGLL